MAIFSIVLGVIIQIFIFTTRTQRRSRSVQEAYAQGRAAVEGVARELQNGSVDYGYYSDPAHAADSLEAQPVDVTALRDSQGQSVRFRCVENLANGAEQACDADTPERGQVELCRGSGCDATPPAWAGVTDEATDVTAWSVWLGPEDDPFRRDPDDVARYLADVQPWLTVAATVQPAPVSGVQLPEARVQATVSSRSYLR